MESGVAEAHLALAEAQLRQARAGPHEDREGARRDLGIERPVIARVDRVEFLAPGR